MFMFYLCGDLRVTSWNFRILDENNSRETSEKLTIVVSLSPQAVLSIAAKYSLGADECAQKLASKLKREPLHCVVVLLDVQYCC